MRNEHDDQDEAVNCALSPVEREQLRARLTRLPDTPPPRAVWERIEAQAQAEGLFRTPGLEPRFRWLAGVGIAAAAAAMVLAVVREPPEDERSFPTEPAYVDRASPVELHTLNALMVQSQQLEQDLLALPEQPQLVRAGTVATIAAVEDQIAAIDYRLNHAWVQLSHEQMEAYWRERVRLMDLLVQLRTAQSQSSAF